MTSADPLSRFAALLEEARAAYPVEWNAMTLSTVGPDHRPSNRVVLLKEVDAQGFVFYTNYQSRKGRELGQNPAAALGFWWPKLERQVRVEGLAHKVSEEESDRYFASRPRGSQLGAWASAQSSVLQNREDLEQRVRELERKYEGVPVPRPPHWGGFRLVPDRIEFWRNRENRLHDREVYRRSSPDEGWELERLQP